MRRRDYINNGLWGPTSWPNPSRTLTAAGTTSANALALSSNFNVFELTTVALNTGVRTFVADPGDEATIANFGANAVLVYPPTGGKANNGSTDAGVSVAAGKTASLTWLSATEILVQVGA